MQVPPPPPGDLPPPPMPVFSVARPAWQDPAYMAPPPGAGAPANVVYAGFLTRFVALLIDGVIVSVALFVVFFVIGIIAGIGAVATGSSTASTDSPSVSILANVIYFVLYAGYFVYFWGMGQTPGMRAFRIYVADPVALGPIGFSRALTRFLGYMLSVLACYVGLIWAAFDPRRQGWHDKLAGSVVVQL